MEVSSLLVTFTSHCDSHYLPSSFLLEKIFRGQKTIDCCFLKISYFSIVLPFVFLKILGGNTVFGGRRKCRLGGAPLPL